MYRRFAHELWAMKCNILVIFSLCFETLDIGSPWPLTSGTSIFLEAKMELLTWHFLLWCRSISSVVLKSKISKASKKLSQADEQGTALIFFFCHRSLHRKPVVLNNTNSLLQSLMCMRSSKRAPPHLSERFFSGQGRPPVGGVPAETPKDRGKARDWDR